MIGGARTLGEFVWNSLRGQHTLLLTVVAAVTLSLFFVPRGAELGLLNLELGFPHRALAILEERYGAGDSSAATVGALVQARAQVGNLAGAVSLLEQLLSAHPHDAELLQALARYYRQLGRAEASLRIAERLAAIHPTQASLQEIAQLYAELDRPIEQRRVLRQLVNGLRPDPGNFVELAKLEKAAGNPAAGIEALRRVESLRPAAVDVSVVALDMALRIAASQVGRAIERAEWWLAKSRMPSRDVLPLASVLSVHGYPALALRLLSPFADKSREPALILATSQAEIDTGRREEALRRLELFVSSAKDKIPLELAQLRLRLAASMGLSVRTADAASVLGVPSVPMDLLAATATAALQSKRSAITEAIRERLKNERSSLAPLFIAETSMALSEREAAAQWAKLAAEDAKDNPEIATRLARLELNLLRKNLALAALRSGLPFVFRDGHRPVFRGPLPIPRNLLGIVARLYAELGMATEGYMVLETVRERQPSPETDQAWALSAAMARRQNAVIEWLKTNQNQMMDSDFLKDLVFVAIKSNGHELALSAAMRLVQERGNDNDRMLLAELKVLLGAPWVQLKPREALASAGPAKLTATRPELN